MADKQHSVFVRGLTKDQKYSLKRTAITRRQSVNNVVLGLIDLATEEEIKEFKAFKKKMLNGQDNKE
jgi:hypothetical protein